MWESWTLTLVNSGETEAKTRTWVKNLRVAEET